MVAPKVARPRLSRDIASERGFTLVEVTVILLVLVILSTIMLPQIGGYNRLARFVRVKEDVAALCSVIKAMLDDVGEGAIFEEAGYDHPPVRTWATGLLLGEGDKPSGGQGRRDSIISHFQLVMADPDLSGYDKDGHGRTSTVMGMKT